MRKLGFQGPIIGVTGNAMPSDIDHYIAGGANTVLVKPVDLSKLDKIITGNFRFNFELYLLLFIFIFTLFYFIMLYVIMHENDI